MLGVEEGKVSLSSHDEAWAEEFKIIREELITILGDNVIEIHHIGSTAIKGILAKPILDVAVIVKDIHAINMIGMEYAGYYYIGETEPGRYVFLKRRNDNDKIDTHHIHFALEDSEKMKSMILFSRYLNEYPEYAKQYNDLKKDLVSRYADERFLYGAGKSEFINMIADLARNKYCNNKD